MYNEFDQTDIMSGELKPVAWEAFREHSSVDYHDGLTLPALPAIHFQWIPAKSMQIDGEVLEYVRETCPESIFKGSTPGARGTYCWVMEMRGKEFDRPNINHRWFMNFRRYSWSVSDSKDGRYGHGHGITYANALHAGVTCETPQQVIRDTMVYSYAQLDVPNTMKHHVLVQPMLDLLLADAIENRTEYAMIPINDQARRGYATGTISSITINGELYNYDEHSYKGDE